MVFGVHNGSYGDYVKAFVTIDGKTWSLKVAEGIESHALLAYDQPQIVEALRTARRLIRFKTDDGWSREFRPAPELAQMIDQCRSILEADHVAMAKSVAAAAKSGSN